MALWFQGLACEVVRTGQNGRSKGLRLAVVLHRLHIIFVAQSQRRSQKRGLGFKPSVARPEPLEEIFHADAIKDNMMEKQQQMAALGTLL